MNITVLKMINTLLLNNFHVHMVLKVNMEICENTNNASIPLAAKKGSIFCMYLY